MDSILSIRRFILFVAYKFVVLDIRAGQGNCNGAGAKDHTEDRWCYIAENVNGRKVKAQTVCPDSVRSSVHTALEGEVW